MNLSLLCIILLQINLWSHILKFPQDKRWIFIYILFTRSSFKDMPMICNSMIYANEHLCILCCFFEKKNVGMYGLFLPWDNKQEIILIRMAWRKYTEARPPGAGSETGEEGGIRVGSWPDDQWKFTMQILSAQTLTRVAP